MSPSSTHLLLALLVVAIWGTNFPIIKHALVEMPPLGLATLRFALAALPGIFLLPRPRVPLGTLAAYGVLIGVGQFGVMYVAMRAQISPGLASLVIQTQVFFTIGLSMALVRERVQPYQWATLALASAGILLIALRGDGAASPLGLGLVLFAAFAWGCANVLGARVGKVNMLAFVVWSSLFAIPPLLALSLVFEGDALRSGILNAPGSTWLAVLWQAYGNTLIGYGAWSWLLARHASASIVPMALLVPVFGMGASALFLGEPMPAWKLEAAALVLAGLAANLLWPRFARAPIQEETA